MFLDRLLLVFVLVTNSAPLSARSLSPVAPRAVRQQRHTRTRYDALVLGVAVASVNQLVIQRAVRGLTPTPFDPRATVTRMLPGVQMAPNDSVPVQPQHFPSTRELMAIRSLLAPEVASMHDPVSSDEESSS